MIQDTYFPKITLSQLERLTSRFRISDDCWQWNGYIDKKGYARFAMLVDGKTISPLMHRVVFYLFNGPIKKGLFLDHLCRNRSCVNPNHLEQVTNLVNIQRGKKNVTHCIHGHEFNELNTAYRTRLMSYGEQVERVCITCKHNRDKK